MTFDDVSRRPVVRLRCSSLAALRSQLDPDPFRPTQAVFVPGLLGIGLARPVCLWLEVAGSDGRALVVHLAGLLAWIDPLIPRPRQGRRVLRSATRRFGSGVLVEETSVPGLHHVSRILEPRVAEPPAERRQERRWPLGEPVPCGLERMTRGAARELRAVAFPARLLDVSPSGARAWFDSLTLGRPPVVSAGPPRPLWSPECGGNCTVTLPGPAGPAPLVDLVWQRPDESGSQLGMTLRPDAAPEPPTAWRAFVGRAEAAIRDRVVFTTTV